MFRLRKLSHAKSEFNFIILLKVIKYFSVTHFRNHSEDFFKLEFLIVVRKNRRKKGKIVTEKRKRGKSKNKSRTVMLPSIFIKLWFEI